VAEDFYSFDKVLRELQMEEEELKRLVSEGEIRAFRDEDKMKFKKEDIQRFRGDGTSDLPTLEAGDGLTEELFGADDGDSGDVGMVTQQISDSSFLEEDVEEIAPLEVESAPERPSGGRRPRAAAGRSSRRREAPEPEGEGTGMQVLLVLSTVVLIYGIFVAFNAAEVQSTDMTAGWANFVKDTFMKP